MSFTLVSCHNFFTINTIPDIITANMIIVKINFIAVIPYSSFVVLFFLALLEICHFFLFGQAMLVFTLYLI